MRGHHITKSCLIQESLIWLEETFSKVLADLVMNAQETRKQKATARTTVKISCLRMSCLDFALPCLGCTSIN